MSLLDYVFSITVDLGRSRTLGETRNGESQFTPILKGEIIPENSALTNSAFPRLRATVLPGGGDQQRIISDGRLEIDARFMAETDHGSLIQIHALGLRRPPELGEVDPYFWVTLRFATSDPALAALERNLFVADGKRLDSQVLHRVYLIR